MGEDGTTRSTIVLAGQSYYYAEQDWSSFPGVALDAYCETGRWFSLYWDYLNSAPQRTDRSCPTGRLLLLYLCLELAAGMCRLKPHIH